MIIVNAFQLLTIITKHSILDVAAALDPPLKLQSIYFKKIFRKPGQKFNTRLRLFPCIDINKILLSLHLSC